MTGVRSLAGDSARPSPKPDVLIAGSGSGGAVLAARLAAGGARVLLLEEGGHYTKDDFTLREDWAFTHLYQDRGNRATADLGFVILQGRSIGGGTTVNWTTSFRTPDRILEHWAKVHGVEGLTAARLGPHWDAIEERLGIHQVGLDHVNRNNGVLYEGAAKLGWQREVTHRNVRGCMKSGYCGMGCPIDAKQSMMITFIPDAIERGAEVWANARVQSLEVAGGRVRRVKVRALDPNTDRPTGLEVEIEPRICVLSCGAINSPALLLRSGLDPNGRLGRRTFIHPVSSTLAIFPDEVRPFYGPPQSVASHQFAVREGRMGFFLEVPPLHPMLAALALTGYGARHREVMAQLPNLQALIALSIDGLLPGDEGGRVSLKAGGGPKVDYPYSEPLRDSFRESMKAMARIQLAAGANAVMTLHSDSIVIKREADLALIDQAPLGPGLNAAFTAHQMGGCAMGADPKQSVVRSDFRHHHVDNLFVVDGSVLPTSLGVNPQETIFGLASFAAGFILKA
jgi:choline dehydrogenase-like flavoprotein